MEEYGFENMDIDDLIAIVTKSLWIFQACNFQCIDKVY